MLPVGNLLSQKKLEHKLRVGVPGFNYDMSRSITSGTVPPVETINDAVQLLKLVGESNSKETVIILDEFDQITENDQRKICADIIKQISDQGIRVRFILCGIGTSMENLIGVHLSTARYLLPIELERLSHEARWEIINSAANVLGVTIGRNFLLRIGQISDGFPYYVHLIGEQLLWSMFDDPTSVGHCMQQHFKDGVNQAVRESEASLKSIYENAVQKYSDDYEEVLWALADMHSLRRQTTDVYEKSYLKIMEERPARKKLTKPQFSNGLNALKTPRHGEIIVATGAGWYEFKENIVRGYVRLRAEGHAVHLGAEGYA
jgi:hypothetical protein